MAVSARILLVSGSTRGSSTNTAVLRTLQAVTPCGVTSKLGGSPGFQSR